MSLASLQPQDELSQGLSTLKKNILSLQSFLSRTIPTLQSQSADLYSKYISQGNALGDKMKGVQKLLTTTLTHVRSDLQASAKLSVKVEYEVNISRQKLTQVLGEYQDFVTGVKAALSLQNPSIVNTVKLGAQAVEATAITAAAKVTQIVEQTGAATLNFSTIIPYLPYLLAGFGVIYLLNMLPRSRQA